MRLSRRIIIFMAVSLAALATLLNINNIISLFGQNPLAKKANMPGKAAEEPTPVYKIIKGKLIVFGETFTPVKIRPLDSKDPLLNKKNYTEAEEDKLDERSVDVYFKNSPDKKYTAVLMKNSAWESEVWLYDHRNEPKYLGYFFAKNAGVEWLSDKIFIFSSGSLGGPYWVQVFYNVNHPEKPRQLDDVIWADADKNVYVRGKSRNERSHVLEAGYIFSNNNKTEEFTANFDENVPMFVYYGDVVVSKGVIHYKFDLKKEKYEKVFNSRILAAELSK